MTGRQRDDGARQVRRGNSALTAQTHRAHAPANDLLDLQRRVGNQAVSALLGHDPVTAQRKPGPTEFVPEMSVKPDQQQARIGQSFREELRVLNWRKAPTGTVFTWGGGPLNPQSIQYVGTTPATREGTARLTGIPLRPGRSEVGANLAYQVPGGPQMTVWGPHIPITTPKPSLLLRYVTNPPARGGKVDLSRLAVGDQFTIQVVVQGTDPGAARLNQAFTSSATTGVLEVVDKGDLASGVAHEFVVEAKKAGQFEYSFDWQVADTDMEAVQSGRMGGSVEMDREKFAHKCSTAHQFVDGKYKLIGAFTKELAIMYGQAWKQHTDALTGANARRQLWAELFIGGALAFVTGGAGGAIGRYVTTRFGKDLYRGAIAGDAVKDLFKDTARRFGRANIPLPDYPAFEAFPTNLTTWQNMEEATIMREAGGLTLLIASWSDAVGNPEYVTDFDPVEEIEKKLLVNNVKPERLGSPDEKEALRFEKGFWKEWLSHYGFSLEAVPAGYAGVRYHVADNIDKPIAERVTACASALGESGEDWISQWAEPRRSEAERQATAANEKKRKERGW